MGDAAEKLLPEVMALPEDERLELAMLVLEAAGNAPDPDWEAAWLTELRRRSAEGTQVGAEWPAMRDRILAGLRRPA
jgi:hypothetical protein